ncbi:MAG: ATP synthase F1 subunit gamma [Cyanobacteria bacterium NC_groundwater_1444_Ag_S-0.65um_54_12]|nr:ATP synthase F1 subunit gamma [Cyanobacteria bacterium NC_groundwater_1444_Ag_S-0.65um_54_12]
MPLNTKEIRRRIKSVQSTQKITKAMEMVAAAKVRRAQQRVLASRPYADKLSQLFAQLVTQLPPGEVQHPLLERREVKQVLLVIITSDKGLCGGYNANLLRHALARLRELQGEAIGAQLLLVGTKGINFFRQSGFAVVGRISGLAAIPSYAEATVLAEEARKFYESRQFDRVELIFTRFQSMMRYQPALFELLPSQLPEIANQERAPRIPYLFEPDAERMMDEVIPAYLTTTIYQAMLDAVASELASRMVAMGSASKAAGEMIDHLTLIYNKARQASITQEILEVVGGAEALKG